MMNTIPKTVCDPIKTVRDPRQKNIKWDPKHESIKDSRNTTQ